MSQSAKSKGKQRARDETDSSHLPSASKHARQSSSDDPLSNISNVYKKPKMDGIQSSYPSPGKDRDHLLVVEYYKRGSSTRLFTRRCPLRSSIRTQVPAGYSIWFRGSDETLTAGTTWDDYKLAVDCWENRWILEVEYDYVDRSLSPGLPERPFSGRQRANERAKRNGEFELYFQLPNTLDYSNDISPDELLGAERSQPQEVKVFLGPVWKDVILNVPIDPFMTVGSLRSKVRIQTSFIKMQSKIEERWDHSEEQFARLCDNFKLEARRPYHPAVNSWDDQSLVTDVTANVPMFEFLYVVDITNVAGSYETTENQFHFAPDNVANSHFRLPLLVHVFGVNDNPSYTFTVFCDVFDSQVDILGEVCRRAALSDRMRGMVIFEYCAVNIRAGFPEDPTAPAKRLVF